MIIEKIEIISFGKFSNKTLDFSEGINTIYGDNESGKSTVIDFIYAMFYGFGDKRGKTLSLREKYTPWQGGECEGKLTVRTNDNARICIYRKSGSVKKYDILRIYNDETGEELKISPEDIVGVNGYTFLKTLCIKQLSSVFEGENDEITQKLSNIASSGDENSDYEKAQKILDSIRREIQPQRGNGGELSALLHKISVCEKNKNIQESIVRELESVKKQIITAEEEEKKALIKYNDFMVSTSQDGPKNKDIVKAYGIWSIIPLLSCICGIIVLVLSFLFTLKNNSFSYLFLATGIFLVLFGLLKTKRNKKHKEKLKTRNKEDEYDEKLQQLKEKVDSSRSILNNLKVVQKSLQVAVYDNEDLSELYKQKEKLEEKLNTVILVSDALKKAHSNMQKNFTPNLNKRASEYFNVITDGKYSRIYCDENFKIQIEKNLPRESSFFSGGTVDQLYLSVRISLADMLFKENGYILILDQPFLQYDDERKLRTLKLLSDLDKCKQVLLFTSDKNLISPNNTTQILT